MKAAIRTGVLGATLSFTTTQKEPAFTPSKNPTDVLVKVSAAAINPVDYKLSRYILGPVYGLDFSGIVEKVGDDVTDLKEGDAVYGRAMGTLTEYCIAKSKEVAKKSDTLSFMEAAALPTAYLTGLQGLRDESMGNVKEGNSVLVVGASGGCGIAAVHLAKALGLKRITAICSGANKDFVKNAGATEVIDYKDATALDNFFADNCKKFDCVYDSATGSGKGEDYTEKCMNLLVEESGEYVQLNGPASVWMKFLLNILPKHQHVIMTKTSKSDLDEISSLLEKSGAKPIVKSMPFTEQGVKDGFDSLKSRRTKGKIVFDIGASSS